MEVPPRSFSIPASDAGSPGRLKWTLGVLGLIVALAVAAAVWMTHASAPSTTTTLANDQSIPLVSVDVARHDRGHL
jgi:hypothetical protein